MKKITLILSTTLLILSSCTGQKPQTPAKQLLQRLATLEQKGFMYGHQDDPFYGLEWSWEQGRSDTRELLGDMPAVLGFDLGGLEEGHDKDLDSVPFCWIRQEAINHVANGGIVTFSWHPRNPRTEGSAWDTSDSTVVRHILPGGEQHDKFVGWMDSVANFLLTLKDANGEPIPFIFRPWHEYNGSWFWWGQKLCSDEEFLALWNMFQDYMNSKMPTNIVWSQSPNLQGNWTEEEFLRRYAGDERVDIVGEDCYQWGTEEEFIAQCANDVEFLSAFAKEHKRLFAITECGYVNSPCADWWGRVFIPTAYGHSVEGAKPLYFLPWRNWYREHFGFSPAVTTAEDVKALYAEKKFLLLHDIQ